MNIDDFLLETFGIENYFDIVEEATKKKTRRKKITKADIDRAKQEAFKKILQSRQYAQVSRGMSYSERMELQSQIRNRIDDNVSDANDFFDKYPYASFFVCTLLAIGGTAYVAKFTVKQLQEIIHLDGETLEYLTDSIRTFFSSNSDLFSSTAGLAGLDLMDLDMVDTDDLSDIASYV